MDERERSKGLGGVKSCGAFEAPILKTISCESIPRKGCHEPSYRVKNLRAQKEILRLGILEDGTPVENHVNFPDHDVEVPEGEPVFEIMNPLPFYGATYILKKRADEFKKDPWQWRFTHELKGDDNVFLEIIKGNVHMERGERLSLSMFPEHVLLSLAANSRDPMVLTELAKLSCNMELDESGTPVGLVYKRDESGRLRPIIEKHTLFEVIVNNPALPDPLKRIMVLNPGVQGENPIVGEYRQGNTHVFEYLRKNSYIPWGHYASNMAHDAVRYSVRDLSQEDMRGLRFLYYQRIYCELARSLDLEIKGEGGMDQEDLEELRILCLETIKRRVSQGIPIPLNGNLWGWNYGFGYASMGYRLHASHQQIHNQYALVPREVEPSVPTYTIGDRVRDFCVLYEKTLRLPFFPTYLKAIRENKRTDGISGPRDLVFYEDQNCMAFCPKAQRSQGEVQLLVKENIGNILEAPNDVRNSIDNAILLVMKALDALGAKMITVYEVSKRFDQLESSQRLFYCFLPRHENSPGSMSEAQGRWITGHYPEDFAVLLRSYIRSHIQG